MKHLVLALFSIIILSACSTNEINVSSLVERNGLVYEINNDDPYDGKVFQEYNNGQIKLKGYYKDGLKVDEWVTYFINGQINNEAYYRDGKYIGDFIEYNYDGTIKSHQLHTGNQKINKGSWRKYWDTEWSIVNKPSEYYSLVTFDDNGIPATKVKYYYQKNDQVQSEHTYTSIDPDVQEGESIWYSDEGIITMKGSYVNGRRDGIWETYYDKENVIGNLIKERVSYKNGALSGTYSFWSTGNDRLFGLRIVNYRPRTNNGFWKLKGSFSGGNKNSKWKVWLLKKNESCWYKTDVYSFAIWDKGIKIESAYLNMNRGFLYKNNTRLKRGEWNKITDSVIKTTKPMFCKKRNIAK